MINCHYLLSNIFNKINDNQIIRFLKNQLKIKKVKKKTNKELLKSFNPLDDGAFHDTLFYFTIDLKLLLWDLEGLNMKKYYTTKS